MTNNTPACQECGKAMYFIYNDRMDFKTERIPL